MLRTLPDPYPYFRGIVAELGFRHATVAYTQPQRARGISKNNLYRLYDLGVQGIVNHSKIPLRLATIVGFCSSVVSLLAALVYFVMKMLFWYDLPIGIAPLIIGLFCVSSVQLFFLGVLGEYVGSIYTQVRNGRLSSRKNASTSRTALMHGADLQRALHAIESTLDDPHRGLPEELFLFVSRITPLVNVDLLIQDDRGHTLLTWRDDEFHGAGWHVPGGSSGSKRRLPTAFVPVHATSSLPRSRSKRRRSWCMRASVRTRRAGTRSACCFAAAFSESRTPRDRRLAIRRRWDTGGGTSTVRPICCRFTPVRALLLMPASAQWRRLSFAVAVALAAVLLYYSLRGIEWRQVGATVSAADPRLLALAAGLSSTNLLLRSLRWRILLQAATSVSPSTTFWATAAGYFGNTFMPARAGNSCGP